MATILIVDPDPATRSLLEVLVLRLGHRSIGQWELAEDESPDLLLLEPASRADMRLAQRLRSRFPELPILCVSIYPPSLDMRKLGTSGHLMKPFRRSQFEQSVESALSAVPYARAAY
jgi:CheY-like chemotaxis protein